MTHTFTAIYIDGPLEGRIETRRGGPTAQVEHMIMPPPLYQKWEGPTRVVYIAVLQDKPAKRIVYSIEPQGDPFDVVWGFFSRACTPLKK